MSDPVLKQQKKANKGSVYVKCIHCNGITESTYLPKRCAGCQKPFLPVGYLFHKNLSSKQLDELYVHYRELNEEDLVIGIMVVWK